jgi:hypothetical protein
MDLEASGVCKVGKQSIFVAPVVRLIYGTCCQPKLTDGMFVGYKENQQVVSRL